MVDAPTRQSPRKKSTKNFQSRKRLALEAPPEGEVLDISTLGQPLASDRRSSVGAVVPLGLMRFCVSRSLTRLLPFPQPRKLIPSAIG